MINRWSYKRPVLRRRTEFGIVTLVACVATFFAASPARAGDAPAWLHALASQTLPSYPPETTAVVLLDERIITVKENGETRTIRRRAVKILRTAGREEGEVVVPFDGETRVSNLHGWCIPAQGKDYEVKDKDAMEVGLGSGMLYADEKAKVLKIPAAEPGNVIGYEYEQKERPYILQQSWWFQGWHPVRQARLALNLPTGWEYRTNWINHAEIQPIVSGTNQSQWTLNDVPALKEEPDMPPSAAVAGRLVVTFFPRDPAARQKTIESWAEFGRWYDKLTAGRREPSPTLQQKVSELTVAAKTPLDKIRALASFVQRDVRYVAIEIGIGGFQPHAAADVFASRYGDCKDKATVLSTMLKQVGVDSYYVVAQTRRGVLRGDSPPAFHSFNHAILAIRLPKEVPTESLYAIYPHARLGLLLFFDPTDSMTPLGYLPSSLQANFGLLVSEAGGELVQMPLLPPSTNQLLRTGKLTLNLDGSLTGEVQEVRLGAPAVSRRAEFLAAQGKDKAKVIESFLGSALSGFVLTHAEVGNMEQYELGLTLKYTFVASNYAKRAGDLILLRPRVLGQKGSSLLEIKERTYPVEFSEASEQRDTYEIKLPPDLAVDELPPPVEADYSFASYRSKTEFSAGVLRYTRSYQVKEVVVPASRLSDLKRFFREIAKDEASSAVLRSARP
jgi:hypothetical protein